MRQTGSLRLLCKRINKRVLIACLFMLFTVQLTYAHAGHENALVIANVKFGAGSPVYAGDQFSMKISLFDFAAIKAKEQGKSLSNPAVTVTFTEGEKTVNVKPQPIGEGDYRAEVTLPTSGDWKLHVMAQRPEDGETAKYEDAIHVKPEFEKIAPLWVWIIVPALILAVLTGYFIKRRKRALKRFRTINP